MSKLDDWEDLCECEVEKNKWAEIDIDQLYAYPCNIKPGLYKWSWLFKY